MGEFTGFLELSQLQAFRKAMIDARLDRHIEILIEPLESNFRFKLPSVGSSGGRLTQVLVRLNEVHNLSNGDVPFAQFLHVARALAAGTEVEALIEQAIAKVEYGGTVPAGAIGIAAGTATVATDGSRSVVFEAPAVNLGVTPEAQTNAYDMTVGIDFLEGALKAASSVVKLLVHRHVGGTPEQTNAGDPRYASGTGWIIGDGLMITNHHVINARSKEGLVELDATSEDFKLQAENTYLLFDYVTKTDVQTYKSGPGALLHTNRELDFAILRIPVGAPARPPLTLRKQAIQKNLIQALGLGVNLLQHPRGDPLRLGFRNNYVVFGDLGSLSYLTDTDSGSSGSPVCDDRWKVAALHSGSRPISDRKIEILGHKYNRENYGIPIAAILEDLNDHANELFGAIQASQPQSA